MAASWQLRDSRRMKFEGSCRTGAQTSFVPFNQDWALRGRKDCSPEEYRASLDQVISWASALGAYTILDLQWLNAETVYGHTHSTPIRGKTPNRGCSHPGCKLERPLADAGRAIPGTSQRSCSTSSMS